MNVRNNSLKGNPVRTLHGLFRKIGSCPYCMVMTFRAAVGGCVALIASFFVEYIFRNSLPIYVTAIAAVILTLWWLVNISVYAIRRASRQRIQKSLRQDNLDSRRNFFATIGHSFIAVALLTIMPSAHARGDNCSGNLECEDNEVCCSYKNRSTGQYTFWCCSKDDGCGGVRNQCG